MFLNFLTFTRGTGRIPSSVLWNRRVRHLWLSHVRTSKTHYQTLGISSAASQADIKRAYYELSMRHHPDKKEGCEEKFRDITTAYEVLGNSRLRKMYDRGLLSDEQPDASVHYPTESSGSSRSYSEEDQARMREMASTFDKYSQEQTSHAFRKAQYGKTVRTKKAILQEKRGVESAEKWLFTFVCLVCVVVFAWIGPGKKGEGGRDKNR